MSAFVVEMRLGIHLTHGSSIGLHDDNRISRGARSRKRANMEKRVVAMKHSLLFHVIVKQRWKLVGSILGIPREYSVPSFLGVQYLSS